MEAKDLEKIVNQYFSENTIEDCFFVDAKITGKKIEVFIDKDGGISYDVCHKVSRIIEEILDRDLPFGDNYTLDVSSPGVGSPLKLARQYKNNLGREIEIKLRDSGKVRGKLTAADDITCTVTEEVTEKVDGKKKKLIINHTNKYEDIIEAKIKISF
ncbi:MAG: hypothetical protein RLZZ546_1574 [Bacteroidota bacterium]